MQQKQKGELVDLLAVNKSKFAEDRYYASIKKDDLIKLVDAVTNDTAKETDYGVEIQGFLNTNSKTGEKFIKLKWTQLPERDKPKGTWTEESKPTAVADEDIPF